MYGEHQDGGMTEIESRDVDFIKNNFISIGNANRDLDLYELEDTEDNIPSLSEGGEIEIPHPVIAENGTSLQLSGSTLLDASGSILDSGSTPQGIQDS